MLIRWRKYQKWILRIDDESFEYYFPLCFQWDFCKFGIWGGYRNARDVGKGEFLRVLQILVMALLFFKVGREGVSE